MRSDVERQVSDDDLVSFGTIEAIVPEKADIDVAHEIREWDGEGSEGSSSVVSCVTQRQFLLLDELVPVTVILRVVQCPEDLLRAFLTRTEVSLEVRAIGNPVTRSTESSQPAQVNEVLQTLRGDTLGEYDICAPSAAEADDYLYVVWKAQIKITRPKAKLQKIGVYLAATAVVATATDFDHETLDDQYLPSLVGLPANVLQSLHHDPRFANTSLLVGRVTAHDKHVQNSSQLTRSIKAGSRQLFRTAPALLWRLRFLTMPDSSRKDETLIALDFEITGFADAQVRIEDVQLTAANARIEALCASFPLVGAPGDQGTLIFRFIHDEHPRAKLLKDNAPHEIMIDAMASVLVSDICQPRIGIKWNTIVETPNVRPLSGSQPVLHASRPLSTEIRASGDLSKPFDPDSLTMADVPMPAQSSATVASGISLTFTGPSKIRVGKIFEWQVFIANKSAKPQRLAIVTVPRAKISHRPGSRSDREGDARMLSHDDRTASNSGAGERHTALICLTPDIRIGPLPASACHEVDIKFLPLEQGVLHLDAIRLIDLSNQFAIDVANIPDIVVDG